MNKNILNFGHIFIESVKKIDVHLFFDSFKQMFGFVIMLVIYLLRRIFLLINKNRTTDLVPKKLEQLAEIFNWRKNNSISRMDLIDLSLRNMTAKKTRTFVTVGGMTLGVGAIVFLVSVGYGLQELVVSRVARLEEMKQAEVIIQPGSQLVFDDKVLNDFKQLSGVSSVQPLLSVVGQVNFKNSISDMAVYGVTLEYLQQSAIRPIHGSFFNTDNKTSSNIQSHGKVAGKSTTVETGQYGQKIRNVLITIEPDSWLPLRISPSTTSSVIGYVKRSDGQTVGVEIWGDSYSQDQDVSVISPNNKKLGKWVEANFEIYLKGCQQSDDCVDGQYQRLPQSSLPKNSVGYVQSNLVSVEGVGVAGQVLGDNTDVDQNNSIDWVEIASESATASVSAGTSISLSESALREAVVNLSMLKILGIPENEAVGNLFNVSFVVVGSLLEKAEDKIKSEPATYRIVGVVANENSPIFYVSLKDLQSLGVNKYSQVKLAVKEAGTLSVVRKKIEAMGYSTRSAVDTVSQINSLFGTARVILALLGMVALAVASLGMFNTLTVSLLERTREVGLMKAMGMKGEEVRELFLTESMIMGFLGGMLGILLGYISGKLLSFLLSIFSVVKGAGFIDISHIPLMLIITVLTLSLVVGLVTGLYPAKRATKISALNALRYE